jgi:hypothetical protein
MATHIKYIIKKFLKEQKKASREQERIKKIINGNLNRALAKNIVVEGVHRNILFVRSDSSSFAYDFNLKKKGLLEALQKELPCLKDVKIKIG